MRRRKLVPLTVLRELTDKCALGIPLATLVKHTQLDISRPALAKLVTAYKSSNNHTVHASLAPVWVDQDYDEVQEQPANFVYVGKFPYGEWYEVN